MPGLFIVLDGPDGSGTSLHARMLCERLREEGHDVVLTAEPTDGSIGDEIRSMLSHDPPPPLEEIQKLFCDDRTVHLKQTILPALEAGKIVICDRYAPSTLAYGVSQGVDLQKLKDLNKDFVQPDVTIFTIPPLSVCFERLGRRDSPDAFERQEMQEKVYVEYEKLAAEDPGIFVVDTSGEKPDVAAKVFEYVKQFLP